MKYHTMKNDFRSNSWESLDEYIEYRLLDFREKRQDTIYYTDKDNVEHTLPPINHFPELKEYEVWLGGYRATGESATASLMGTVKARNWGQACHIIMCQEKLKWIKEKENNPEHKGYVEPGRWDYDPTAFTYWACGLFWSEEVARKQFG